MNQQTTHAELEADRLASLREHAVEYDIRPERYGPGTFGCHEAMHVASMIADVVGQRLCEHPAVLLRPDWYKLAAVAHTSLFELYQAIGTEHLGNSDQKHRRASCMEGQTGEYTVTDPNDGGSA